MAGKGLLKMRRIALTLRLLVAPTLVVSTINKVTNYYSEKEVPTRVFGTKESPKFSIEAELSIGCSSSFNCASDRKDV